MSLGRLLLQQVTATRLVAGAGVTKSYQSLGTYNTMIQPMSDTASVDFGLAIGTGFHAFLPLNTDIKVADRLTDASGTSYVITGLRTRAYGHAQHITAYMTLETAK